MEAMNLNEGNGIDKGNMSVLEKKVDILLRLLLAQTDVERNACYGNLKMLQCADEPIYRQPEVSSRIDKVLEELGIPDHLRGYGYLHTAVMIMLRDPKVIHSVTGVLYPQVAMNHKTVPTAVERGMRHAIECGWSRCDPQIQVKYFGSQIHPDRAKPTNTQFILKVTNVVRRSISRLQN